MYKSYTGVLVLIDLFQQEINFLTAVRSSVLTVSDSNENETSVSVSGDFHSTILYIYE
jgi:hypothetical protein